MAGKKGQVRYDRETVLMHVYCDLVNGLTKMDIRDKLADNQYVGQPTKGLCQSAVSKLLRDALEMFKVERESEIDYMRDLWYNRITNLYNASIENGDRQTALGCLKEFAKFADLYPKPQQKVELSGSLDHKVEIDFGFDEGTVQG